MRNFVFTMMGLWVIGKMTNGMQEPKSSESLF